MQGGGEVLLPRGNANIYFGLLQLGLKVSIWKGIKGIIDNFMGACKRLNILGLVLF